MVVLATKLYVHGDARDRAVDGLTSLVGNELADLDVEYEVGVRNDDFPSVTVSGDDEVVARNVLAEAFGEIDSHMDAGETYVGTLDSWSDDGFVLDAGQDVYVPAENVLITERDAWREQLARLNWDRVVIAMWTNAVARCAIERAVAYAETREQFGQPIGEFQALR